jgi:ABC-type multidrug transport system permease subunit
VAQGKLFGGGPVGAITIVETPVSQWYIRRARIAFLGVGMASGVVTAVLLSAFVPLLLAVVLGVNFPPSPDTRGLGSTAVI